MGGSPQVYWCWSWKCRRRNDLKRDFLLSQLQISTVSYGNRCLDQISLLIICCNCLRWYIMVENTRRKIRDKKEPGKRLKPQQWLLDLLLKQPEEKCPQAPRWKGTRVPSACYCRADVDIALTAIAIELWTEFSRAFLRFCFILPGQIPGIHKSLWNEGAIECMDFFYLTFKAVCNYVSLCL